MAVIINNMNMPKTCTMCWFSNICQGHINDLKHIGFDKRLDDCPLEEVKPVVRGEWILNDDQVCECKDCGYVPSFDGYTYYNYCPNCGAYMKGDEDESL